MGCPGTSPKPFRKVADEQQPARGIELLAFMEEATCCSVGRDQPKSEGPSVGPTGLVWICQSWI